MVYSIGYMVGKIGYTVYDDIWYIVYRTFIWCMLHGIRYTVYGTQYAVYIVRSIWHMVHCI